MVKPLNDVIADINGKKWPEALAAANKAKAAAKTDYEKMKVNQFLTIVLLNSGDNAGATAAAEAAADPDRFDPRRRPDADFPQRHLAGAERPAQ